MRWSERLRSVTPAAPRRPTTQQPRQPSAVAQLGVVRRCSRILKSKPMKALLGLLALLVSGAITLRGEDAFKPDESIRALVRYSTLIIDADIVQPYLFGSVDEFIVSYSARVRVRDTLFGQAPAPELWVRVSAPQFDFSAPPACLQKRQRCVFFLRPDDSGRDGFMGALHLPSAQRYRPELVSAVRRLTKSK